MSLVETGYFCYYYDTPLETGFGTLPVCVVRPSLTYIKPLTVEAWYKEGPTTYPDTWFPLGINLAENRNAKIERRFRLDA